MTATGSRADAAADGTVVGGRDGTYADLVAQRSPAPRALPGR